MTEPPKTYTIIAINGTQYHIAPECATMIEAVCRDERYQRMFSIPFDWLRLTVDRAQGRKDGKGGAMKVEVAGG